MTAVAATIVPGATRVAGPLSAIDASARPFPGSTTDLLLRPIEPARSSKADELIRIELTSNDEDHASQQASSFSRRFDLSGATAAILRGLPLGTHVSTGFELSPGTWILPAAALDSVRVEVPSRATETRVARLSVLMRTGDVQPLASIELHPFEPLVHDLVLRAPAASRPVPLAPTTVVAPPIARVSQTEDRASPNQIAPTDRPARAGTSQPSAVSVPATMAPVAIAGAQTGGKAGGTALACSEACAATPKKPERHAATGRSRQAKRVNAQARKPNPEASFGPTTLPYNNT